MSSNYTTSTPFENLTYGVTNDVSKFDPTVGKVIEIIILIILCILILLGNALVILAFMKGPRNMRTYTNYFVVNLAICDFMVGCLLVPTWILEVLEIPESKILHRYFISMDVLFSTASILSLVAISIERMAAVKYPTRHFNVSNVPVYSTIFSTWIVGIVLFAFKIWLVERNMLEYTTIVLVVSFILPLLIIIASYILLFQAAHDVELADNLTHAQSLQRDLRIAKMISIIIGLFVFCWAPFFAINVMYYIAGCETCISTETLSILISISKIMHYSNSMMNFFVYAARSPDFRRTFKALLFRCDTSHLRERLRTISMSNYRKRTTSLRPNNNTGSFINMENSKQSMLTVPNKEENGHNRLASNDTVVSELSSESPTIGLLDYS